MFKPITPRTPIVLLLLGLQLSLSCSPASYEIIRPKLRTKTDQPQAVAPPALPPSGELPRARVETIVNNESVTNVHINVPTNIRPTADTLSPSFIGKSSCVNQGIQRAGYDIGGLAQPVVTRSAGCEALDTPYTFTIPGDYLITMIVTDELGQTATASMTLTVVDDTASSCGFNITVTPVLAQKNQPFTFDGFCDMSPSHSINWEFGDGVTAKGNQTTHAYDKAGAFAVNATCTADDGSVTKKASTTVAVSETAIATTITILTPKCTLTPPPVLPKPACTPGQGPNHCTAQSPTQR